MYPMRRLLLALVSLALAACNTPVTGVVRLNDGIFRAASPQEAEAYCRKDGNPIRFLQQADAPAAPAAPAASVLFRCD
jgi:putative hemolysin